jgi:hypothetical protein
MNQFYSTTTQLIMKQTTKQEQTKQDELLAREIIQNLFEGIKRTFQDRLPDSRIQFLLFDEAAKINRETNTRVRKVE